MITLIRSGTIVRSTGSFIGDVLIEKGKIKAIGSLGEQYSRVADNVIDASGKYVLPGMIDPHTHINMPIAGTCTTDTFRTGSIAAVCGGITSFLDFEHVSKGQSVFKAFENKINIISRESVLNFGIHISISEFNDDVEKELIKIIDKYGPVSFKLYMTYSLMMDDRDIIKMFAFARDKGCIILIHAENDNMIRYQNDKFEKEGKLSLANYPLSRPNIAEAEAINRAIYFAQLTDSQLYIVHLSTKEGLEAVNKAQQKGLRVYAETCPQYLLLDEAKYKLENDTEIAKYIVSPPLRSLLDREALWSGIKAGNIQTIGSDHCPLNLYGIKNKYGLKDYRKILGGMPGIETSLMLLYSEGVRKNIITIEKLVEITSTNVAKIFGLQNKGDLIEGKTADIIIFDPEQDFEINCENLHMNIDYNPFEGYLIKGMPFVVLLKGEIVAKYDNNKVNFLNNLKKTGDYIPRKKSTFFENYFKCKKC